MMNNDNSITVETKLYGFIAENAHSNRTSVTVNKLYKADMINAMMIPMNIRPDDVAFTISQMRSSKLNGALIGAEYQEEALGLVDRATQKALDQGYCDFIEIMNGELQGDLIMADALEKYSDQFESEIALESLSHYFVDLTRGEKNE